jgi:hypothetical protein
MGTSITAIPIPQQGSDRSPNPVVPQTPATTWLLERRSTSPILPTIPATRCHSSDPDSPEHCRYQKHPKPGHYYNLYDHEDLLTKLTGTISPPLHLEEQAKSALGPCSLQTDICLPELESIPEEDAAPPRGHHKPPMMLEALSPTDDS